MKEALLDKPGNNFTDSSALVTCGQYKVKKVGLTGHLIAGHVARI